MSFNGFIHTRSTLNFNIKFLPINFLVSMVRLLIKIYMIIYVI